MAAKGISMVPEGRHLFPKLSIYDNLMMGAYTIKDKNKIKEKLDVIYDIFPILAERKHSSQEPCPVVNSRWSQSAGL